MTASRRLAIATHGFRGGGDLNLLVFNQGDMVLPFVNTLTPEEPLGMEIEATPDLEIDQVPDFELESLQDMEIAEAPSIEAQSAPEMEKE